MDYSQHMFGRSRQADQKSVLVVEDDVDLRDSLCDLLRDEGYAVAGAANGQEALTWLQTHPRPRLVLLDLMMPVMSGPELRERMMKSDLLRDIPVAVVSALDVSRQQSSIPGASAYLKKPVDPVHLLAIVSRLAEREARGPAKA
jgi:CheY-like chemotaxis protein